MQEHNNSTMTPIRPYLLRTIYDWIVDNNCTPYILVDTNQNGVIVPEQYIENNQITLNLSPGSIRDLSFDNDWVMFNARFSGAAWDIEVPMSAVNAIYAKENGQGMVFDKNQEEAPQPPAQKILKTKKPSKPSLKIVK